MSISQVKKLEAVLTRACDAFTAKGGKIIARGFQNYNNEYCPIGVLLINNKKVNEDYFAAVNRLANVNIDQDKYWAFIYSFDNTTHDTARFYQKEYPEFAALGERLRQKYIG